MLKKLELQEVNFIKNELNRFRQDSPAWYEFGRNLSEIDQVMRKIERDYDRARKVIIEKFALKDEKGNYIYKEESKPDATGQLRKQKFHDCGENQQEADEMVNKLWKETFQETDEGPVMIEIDLFMVKSKNGSRNHNAWYC